MSLARQIEFLALVLFLFLAQGAYAKCRSNPSDMKFQTYSQTPIFVLGVVKQSARSGPKGDETIDLKISVIKVLKGKYHEHELAMKYQFHGIEDDTKVFSVGEKYVFGVDRSKEETKINNVASCTPTLTESEIVNFKREAKPEGSR